MRALLESAEEQIAKAQRLINDHDWMDVGRQDWSGQLQAFEALCEAKTALHSARVSLAGFLAGERVITTQPTWLPRQPSGKLEDEA